MNQVYNRVRLGLNIRRRRHHLRLTQAELAERVGCGCQCISALERGRQNISVERLFAISRVLECSVTDLLQNVE